MVPKEKITIRITKGKKEWKKSKLIFPVLSHPMTHSVLPLFGRERSFEEPLPSFENRYTNSWVCGSYTSTAKYHLCFPNGPISRNLAKS